MLPYLGSKSKVGKWIREFINKDIQNYAEPFGGMFKVYYNMDLGLYPNLDNIIYNDYNLINANIFNCVQQDYNRLREFVESVPYAIPDNSRKGEKDEWFYEKLYYSFKQNVFNSKIDLSNPNFNLGAQYAYILSHCYSGCDPKKSAYVSLKNAYQSKFQTFIKKLNNKGYQEHFERITNVHGLDFKDCFKMYDDKSTCFYLDPPYKGMEHYYSNHNFFTETHERLAKQIKALKGQWILSYYFFDELLESFPPDQYRWYCKNFSRPSAKGNGRGKPGKELLILNYEPDFELKNIPQGTRRIYNERDARNIAA